MAILWGIDLGGTKIEGAVFDQLTPEKPLARIRLDTEASRGYQHIIERIAELVGEMKRVSGLNPEKIGFSTPGTLDPATRAMKNCNTVCLNGNALDQDLSQRLSVPVRLQNDANCFALTEAAFGAGKNGEVVFGVIMGTGVGGGLIVNKRVIGGAQGIAGEWGHNVLDANGPMCYCGRKGCVEMLMAGPKLELYYQSIGGEALPMKQIYQRSKSGDPKAIETVERLTSLFARAIAQVINIVDPSVIVLGGGLSNIDELYTQSTRDKIAREIFNTGFHTPLVKNELGDSAGVFGAGFLCLD